MSNNKSTEFLFSQNQQRVIFAVIALACLLIIIGLLNIELDFSDKTAAINRVTTNSNQTSLPASSAVYSRSGEISNINNDQIEILVSQLEETNGYLIVTNDQTTYYQKDIGNEQNAVEIALADLQIGDTIYVSAESDITNLDSFIANKIELINI